MPFTLEELDNITNAVLDFHLDPGNVQYQTNQDKPLLREMDKRAKEFPSGKENITVRVKGEITTEVQGFEGDDEVDYDNPVGIKTGYFPWKELHWGIKCTLTELKKDGISITNTNDGTGESRHDGRERTALANLLDEKIEDMQEGSARGLNQMYWLDGTQDSKVIPGVKSFIVDSPSSSVVVAGIDQGLNTWWRNRANLAISVAAAVATQPLLTFMQSEIRQLRRYASKTPKHIALCGSDWLDQLEAELRANGTYTMTGWKEKGVIDAAINDVAFKGIMFEYDPTLDDMGEADRCYILDMAQIFPMNMTGENMKRHSPSRPENKYVIYRAVTKTGGLVCKQRNSSGVYGLA